MKDSSSIQLVEKSTCRVLIYLMQTMQEREVIEGYVAQVKFGLSHKREELCRQMRHSVEDQDIEDELLHTKIDNPISA